MRYIILILLLTSCRSQLTDDNGKTGDELGPNLITVNKCQYVVYRTGEGVSIVHAGNCNNHQEVIYKPVVAEPASTVIAKP
jgi:hypothetical protein